MKRILFVHDLQDHVWERRSILESSGFEVDTISDGNAALERIERKTPDLVVADVLVEGLDGFELASLIRSRFDADQLPIVVCAGIYKDAHFERAALDLGVQRYLTVADGPALVAAIMSILQPERTPAAPESIPETPPAPVAST